MTDAKLLCLISISSTFRALETVSLKSLLSTGPLSLSLLLPAGLLSFLINSLVACCSTNLRVKFFLGAKLENCFGPLLLSEPLYLNGFFFSILNTSFFLPPLKFISIFLANPEEILSVFFYFYLFPFYLNTIFLADIMS